MLIALRRGWRRRPQHPVPAAAVLRPWVLLGGEQVPSGWGGASRRGGGGGVHPRQVDEGRRRAAGREGLHGEDGDEGGKAAADLEAEAALAKQFRFQKVLLLLDIFFPFLPQWRRLVEES